MKSRIDMIGMNGNEGLHYPTTINFMDGTVSQEPRPTSYGVSFITPDGKRGVIEATQTADELYVDEFVQLLGKLYEEVGFLNDIKIVVNPKDKDRKCELYIRPLADDYS